MRDSPERDIWFLGVMLQGSYQMWRVLAWDAAAVAAAAVAVPPIPPPAPRGRPPRATAPRPRPPPPPPPPAAPYAVHTDQVGLDESYIGPQKVNIGPPNVKTED